MVALCHGNTWSVCITLHGDHMSAVMQKGPVVLLVLSLSRGAAGQAVGGVRREQLPVWLEGGPLHCKRVSSRSHSEPVSFPAVSRHAGSLQGTRGQRESWAAVCVLGESGSCGCQGVVSFQGNKQFGCLRYFIYLFPVCLFTAHLPS